MARISQPTHKGTERKERKEIQLSGGRGLVKANTTGNDVLMSPWNVNINININIDKKHTSKALWVRVRSISCHCQLAGRLQWMINGFYDLESNQIIHFDHGSCVPVHLQGKGREGKEGRQVERRRRRGILT